MRFWRLLGARLGIGVAALGLVLVFLGWNGAASHDRVPSQFPYLISGGIGGLALVVIGAAIAVAQSARADRAALQATIRELQDAIERSRLTPPADAVPDDHGVGVPTVGAGSRSYHRPTCRLVEGRAARIVPLPTAAEMGLEACRICTPDRGPPDGHPGVAAGSAPTPETTRPGAAQRRRKTRPVRGFG